MSRLLSLLAPVLRAALLVAGITVLVFVLVRVVPGDVVDVLAVQGDLTDAQQADLRRHHGLDAAPAEQFAAWIARALDGDLGLSLRFRTPVIDLILHALPTTLLLTALSFAVGLTLALAVAVGAALWPQSRLAALVNAINVWSIAVPTFCVGVLGILVFCIWLRWMPVLGNLVIPVAVVGLDIAGQLVKPLHEELREAATAAHVRTARAKGLHPLRVVLFHVLPAALPVVLALSGLILAGLIGGTLTMEVLFGLPGIGSLALTAIHGRDYPLIQATILFLAVAVVLINLATDLLQRVLDPRLQR
ncbi:ABC transporter permease [Azospirillum halopraeferens]|uniref:ABC transporter permease n=1 Tax=Azospirillum halopraeferens TaxID=34010 RepID=UPI0003F81D37|nr:ABC transporter permease [Azospirillum halopraeferens]